MIPATQLQRNVLAELDWDPSIDASKVGVTVDDGVVTLTGQVNSYADKLKTENVVQRVRGVRAVADDLEVKLPLTTKRSDTDLAKAALQTLEWDVSVPHDALKVTVKGGWVTLEGEVEWNFQRENAARAVRRLTGVLGVMNRIAVRPRVQAVDVKAKIEDALRRHAEIDAHQINVHVEGSKVILSGTVRSLAERRDATNAAWSARGVTDVEDHIRMSHEVMAY